jgi:hypothetical protein
LSAPHPTPIRINERIADFSLVLRNRADTSRIHELKPVELEFASLFLVIETGFLVIEVGAPEGVGGGGTC